MSDDQVTLTAEERYEIGLKLGWAINLLFQVVAKLEGVTMEEAVQRSLVEPFVAERIMENRRD